VSYELTYEKLCLRIPATELRQLLDVAADGDIEAVANDIIADVSADVLSYVAARRTPPTAGESRKLQAIMFRWFLWQVALDRRSLGDDAQKAHEADVKWLEAYAEGKGSLGDDDETMTPAEPQQSADTRVFTRDKMKGF